MFFFVYKYQGEASWRLKFLYTEMELKWKLMILFLHFKLSTFQKYD
jgi:hypothetical protein